MVNLADERALVERMIRLACAEGHAPAGELCAECAALLEYVMRRLAKCPYGADKPTCRVCPIHCYRPAERQRIKEVMRFAGPRLLAKGDFAALKHLLHGIKRPPAPKGGRPGNR